MKLIDFSKLKYIRSISNSYDYNILLKEFSHISIVTCPGDLFWIEEEDFVFFVLDFLSQNDALEAFKIIISKNIIGCCLVYDDTLNTTYNKLITLFNQNKLPLFELKKENLIEGFWHDIFPNVMAKDEITVFLEQQLRNNIICLVNSSHFNKKNLIYLVSFFMQRECYLLSSQFNLLCCCSPTQNKLSYDLPFKKWSEDLSILTLNESISSKYIMVNFNADSYYCFPLKAYKNTLGYLCIKKNHQYFNRLNTYFIAEILPNFTLCMISNFKDELIHHKSVEEFLQSVLYGLFTDENTLKRETEYFNFKYSLDRFVWILRIESLNNNKYLADHGLSISILSKIKSVMQQVFYENIFLIEKCQITTIEIKDEKTDDTILDKFDILLEDISLKFPEYRFYIGLSRAYNDIFQLKYAYEDAVFSLRMGKKYFWGEKNVYCYNDLLTYHFLHDQIHNPILKRLYINTIEKIKAHDLEKGDQLYKTLNELISSNFNIKQTYENLYIHRNTLYQRIKKIEKIIGLSLKSSETKLWLQLGLKLDHIHAALIQPREK